jgi:CRP-like cAMP-binding protein
LTGYRPFRWPPPKPRTRPANVLLRALSDQDFAVLEPQLEPVALTGGSVLVAQDEPITFVCFPECGVTSVADVHADGTRIEVALIGREGMTNSQFLLGCGNAPHEVAVQIGGGRSLRVPAEALRLFCRERPAARALFLRFVHALSVQTARTLVSTVRDPAEKRLSRWILMCHDRVEGDEIHLTHDHIAQRLGVRRATVTNALHILEGERAIRSTRGLILVRDRQVLEAAAGASYGFAETSYSRLIAPFGKSPALIPRPQMVG